MSAVRTTKSLEALSASLNRALAGARAPQVAAAHRAQLRQAATGGTTGPHLRAQAASETLAARSRTNMLIGTLERLRRPVTGLRAGRSTS